MGKYYRSIKFKRLIALLEKLGFYKKSGSKHAKYVRDDIPGAIIVPRHRKLSPGTVEQICKTLEDNGIDSSDIERLL